MGLGYRLVSIISGADSEGGFLNTLSDANFPGVVLLGAGGSVGLFFIIRWMVGFQREFTEFYVAENRKLREEVETLRKERDERDEEVNKVQREHLDMEKKHAETIRGLETKVAEHQTTIDRLQRIINGNH